MASHSFGLSTEFGSGSEERIHPPKNVLLAHHTSHALRARCASQRDRFSLSISSYPLVIPNEVRDRRIWWKITQNKLDVVRRCEVPRRLRGSG